MEKIIAALILIAVLVGGYRFVSSRRKAAEETPAETVQIEPTATPTPEGPEVVPEAIEGGVVTDQDLPSSGVSSEEKPMPSEEELERMIKEFESSF